MFSSRMEERPETELISIPTTPRASTPEIPTPSGMRSPRPVSNQGKSSTARTPTSFISPRFLSPIGTPMKRVLINMKGYLEEVGHLTKHNPQDAWLPKKKTRSAGDEKQRAWAALGEERERGGEREREGLHLGGRWVRRWRMATWQSPERGEGRERGEGEVREREGVGGFY